MKQSQNVREQALKSARFHLQTKGFNGFSFQDVADDLGIKKASLHYYFASKDQLGLELLSQYRQGFLAWTEKTKLLNPQEKIQNMIDFFVALSGGGKKICPIGALCADIHSLSPELKAQLQEFNQIQYEWLMELLKESQNQKIISREIDTEVASLAIISQIQGALQVARIKGGTSSIRKQIEGMFRLMGFAQTKK